MRAVTAARILASFCILGVPLIAALAKGLPEKAIPMAPDEIRHIHAGNSAIWNGMRIYFSQDMAVMAVINRGERRMPYAGRWYVSGNEVCVKLESKDDPRKYFDCWKWWWSGADIFTLWSVRFDQSKPDERRDYYDGAMGMEKGNKISRQYKELGGQPVGVCIQC